MIAAYIAPSCPFDVDRLNTIIRQCPHPILVTGDFNAHNPAWGSARTTRRGRELLDLVDEHDLCVLNDGTPTYVRGTRCSSCLDVSFMSCELVSRASWFTDVETHGSDHTPTYITLHGLQPKVHRNLISHIDWTSFKENVELKLRDTSTYNEFISTIQQSVTECRRSVHLPSSRTEVDGEYERLRAIRRRAERRARRTKLPDDVRIDRRTQKHIRRHLDKLARKKWRGLCASFDPRAPMTQIWHIARGLRSTPQQRSPFNALSIFLRRSLLDIAEDYCASLVDLPAVATVSPPIVDTVNSPGPILHRD